MMTTAKKRSKDDPEILFGSKASQPQLSKLDPAQRSKKRPSIFIGDTDDDHDVKTENVTLMMMSVMRINGFVASENGR